MTSSWYWMLHLAVLMMLLIVTDSADTGHIPVGSSSLAAADLDAIRFQFGRIHNNINFILPNLDVNDHNYSVTNDGYIKLYVQTEEFPAHSFLSNSDFTGIRFNCWYNTTRIAGLGLPSGKVVKFLSSRVDASPDIPQSWHNSSDIVLSILIPAILPVNLTVPISCSLVKTVQFLSSTTNVNVSTSFTVKKEGCPRNRWGLRCSLPCSCVNNGECHTFKGHCICPKNTTGTFCEKRVTIARLENTTSPLEIETTTTAFKARHPASVSNITQTDAVLLVDFRDPIGQAPSISYNIRCVDIPDQRLAIKIDLAKKDESWGQGTARFTLVGLSPGQLYRCNATSRTSIGPGWTDKFGFITEEKENSRRVVQWQHAVLPSLGVIVVLGTLTAQRLGS